LFVIVDWSWGHFWFCTNKNKKHAGACKAPVSASAAPPTLSDVCG